MTKYYYPKSFLKLLLIGFAVIVVPLAWSLVDAAFDVARLAGRSQQAVYDAAEAARGSRELAELVTAMERTLRQYLILGDAALLDDFQRLHNDFIQTAADLSQLRLGEGGLSGLPKLVAREQESHARFLDLASGKPTQQQAAEDFVALSELAQAVVADSSAMIGREVNRMREEAAAMQHGLYLRLLAVIPAVLLAAFTFTVLIARPIGQLDQAIRRLGSAQFDSPVSVAGPRDLVYLGERLDWLRRRLVELEEQKGKFMRAVSHELKTPLAALREGAALLADGSTGAMSEEQEAVARIVFNNSVHLQKLIEDLLDYQRSRASELNLHRERFALDELAREMAKHHELAARSRDVAFDFDTQPCEVQADRTMVRTIIDNLYANAVKYSPAGGRIGVLVWPVASGALLQVADNGPGVPAEERERIFEPFYQGRIPPEGPVKGSGLGLAIARELAQIHGGRLELDDAPHGGAMFRLMLPFGAPEAADHATMAASLDTPPDAHQAPH